MHDGEFAPQPDRLDGVAADQLLDALRTCRLALRETAADLRFEAPAAHGCRMVIAAIDALAHLITGRAHLFAEQDVGTRRNQTGEEIGEPAVDGLLDALGECRGSAIEVLTRVKVQGVMYNAIRHAHEFDGRAGENAHRRAGISWRRGCMRRPWPAQLVE